MTGWAWRQRDDDRSGPPASVQPHLEAEERAEQMCFYVELLQLHPPPDSDLHMYTDHLGLALSKEIRSQLTYTILSTN